MTATYTYLFHDLLTNEQLAALPLSDVSFGRELGGIGELGATLKGLGTRRIRKLDPMGATRTGRTAVYVDRDGTLVWGGILWGRRGTDTLQLRAEEFRSYWRRRRIRWDADYVAHDQAAILCELLERAAAEPGGDIGLVLPPPALRITGIPRHVSYAAAERKVIEEAWGELEGLAAAFETSVEVGYGPTGLPFRALHWGTPLGADRGLVVEKPGNLLDHGGWPEDAATMANRITAIGGTPDSGDGGEGTPLMAEATALHAGWPLLEDSTSYSDLDRPLFQAVLQAHADRDLDLVRNPAETPELVISGDDPPLGSYRPGDQLRVRITDPRFPRPADGGAGLDTELRIIGYQVSPPSSGRETVALTVGSTVHIERRRLRRRLRHLERRLWKLEARQRARS